MLLIKLFSLRNIFRILKYYGHVERISRIKGTRQIAAPNGPILIHFVAVLTVIPVMMENFVKMVKEIMVTIVMITIAPQLKVHLVHLFKKIYISKYSDAFWRDRTLKRAKRALYIIIILILAGVGISWITYRRNPAEVQEFIIALLAKCCNLFGTRMHPNGMTGPFRPSFSTQQDALINETNGDSGCTKETYLANIDDTGSGVGPTVCVQRTIARQIKSMER